VLLVRQYRHPAEDYLWELCAGGVDEGESELEAAKRELLEETGYAAEHWERALKFYVSPGFLDETMAVFLARGLRRGKSQPEADELINKRLFPLSTALGMIETRRIQDAKTICGLLWLNQIQNSPKPHK
jgi:ADP-ribose pyrophosphatase